MNKAPEANLDEGPPDAHFTSVVLPSAIQFFGATSIANFVIASVVHDELSIDQAVVPCLPEHFMDMHDVPVAQAAFQEPEALQSASVLGWTGSFPSFVLTPPTQHCA
jgi:hypothetical protein